ncbi:synembryn [Methylobacterium sp. J-070]|uniref:synembryn n=1 Tax=Methylobacterium sp. J-070 TaxID=2836650 RepID=UPI001FB918C3|nr:synembryn [Methylobacterium sp. J-070]MCJ2054782.1 synembryn [Methylobacterium sp. J-070]
MRPKEFEARVVRLEATRKANPFAGMTEEEIEAEARQMLDLLISSSGSSASVVAEMAASDEPVIRDGARTTVEWFGERYGYLVQHAYRAA